MTGAALVEFALVFLMLMILISGFIQFVVVFYQYNVLSDSMTSALRKVAVNTQTTSAADLTDETNPLSVQKRVIGELTVLQLLNNSDQVSFPPGETRICRSAAGVGGVCQIQVKTSWAVPCLFCLIDIRPSISLRNLIPVEDPCFLEAADCVNAPLCN